MKIVSFNVNSVRLRLHQLKVIIDRHDPEFIGLQETKVQDHEFPVEAINDLGYEVIFMGQKTHYGVALLSKTKAIKAVYGFPNDAEDAQKRFIGGEFEVNGEIIHCYNGYFPQGESEHHETKFPAKRKFYADLSNFLQGIDAAQKVIVIGDYNIAPVDEDIGIGADNAKRWLKAGKASFLPEERDWFQRIIDLGYCDSFRRCYPNVPDQFSWFDYRSKGFDREPRRGLRIDHLLVSQPLHDKIEDSGIDADIRGMEKPSDHAPAWLKLQ
ncbi:MAG: exodeoxyribonuclease III [Gammaproteobacteria bacterium]|nr:exodeoxyribonuclease III [Gammaproteobacteria bacterium]